MSKKAIALFLSILFWTMPLSYAQHIDDILVLIHDYQLNDAYEALKIAIESDPINKSDYLLALLEIDDFNGNTTQMLENAISLLDLSPTPLAEMLGHYYI